jgi:hypothetical protein
MHLKALLPQTLQKRADHSPRAQARTSGLVQRAIAVPNNDSEPNRRPWTKISNGIFA